MADDRFQRFKQMAKNEFNLTVDRTDWNKEEVQKAIHELSDIRAKYNLFDDEEFLKYHACCLAIKALREIIGG